MQNWFWQSHAWPVQPDWLVNTPGVVNAICTAIRALTQVGDGVIIQQPVYYPFAGSVLSNKRCLVVNKLVLWKGTGIR
ncbi:hypothetical protein [Sporotomaculum syntrophicum]|uniref:hypothetical protein n=1 Tax=Sporotomaculum syntrophicum TaxID=182264 RepID=UPI00311AA6CA